MASITSPLRPAKPPPPTRVVTRQKAGNVQRERHEPEYAILLAIVALTAVGILMVYSSSAMKAYLERDDTFAIVGPQIVWAALGIGRAARHDAHRLPLLRLAAVPLLGVAFVFLVIVLLPPVGPISPRIVGGSARWLQIGPLPSVHPAEFAKLALVVYLASWLAQRGTRIKSFVRGTVPFLLLVGPVVVSCCWSPISGRHRSSGSPRSRCSSSPARGCSTSRPCPRRSCPSSRSCSSRATRSTGSAPGSTRGRTRTGIGFHSIQSYLALALGGVTGAGLGPEPARGWSVPAQRLERLHLRDHRRGVRAGRRRSSSSCCSSRSRTLASARPSGAGHVRRAARRRASRPGSCIQAFINIGVVVGLFPITGITLPFI